MRIGRKSILDKTANSKGLRGQSLLYLRHRYKGNLADGKNKKPIEDARRRFSGSLYVKIGTVFCKEKALKRSDICFIFVKGLLWLLQQMDYRRKRSREMRLKAFALFQAQVVINFDWGRSSHRSEREPILSSPQDIRQSLETFLLSPQDGGRADMQWTETQNSAQHL